MKEIKVSRGQYRMILRNDLIKQAADKAKYGKAIYAQRVDNMVGRLTARALDKDVQFNKSLKNWRDAIQARASAGRPWQKAKALVKEFQARTSVGRQWHSKAKEIGKKAHQRIVRLGLAPKRTTFSV